MVATSADLTLSTTTERHYPITVAGVQHLLHSIVDGGFLTTKPFIVHFLKEDEQMDRSNDEEFSMQLIHKNLTYH